MKRKNQINPLLLFIVVVVIGLVIGLPSLQLTPIVKSVTYKNTEWTYTQTPIKMDGDSSDLYASLNVNDEVTVVTGSTDESYLANFEVKSYFTADTLDMCDFEMVEVIIDGSVSGTNPNNEQGLIAQVQYNDLIFFPVEGGKTINLPNVIYKKEGDKIRMSSSDGQSHLISCPVRPSFFAQARRIAGGESTAIYIIKDIEFDTDGDGVLDRNEQDKTEKVASPVENINEITGMPTLETPTVEDKGIIASIWKGITLFFKELFNQ